MAKLNIRNRNANKVDKDGKPKLPNWEYRFEGAKIEGKRKQISQAGSMNKKKQSKQGQKPLRNTTTPVYLLNRQKFLYLIS